MNGYTGETDYSAVLSSGFLNGGQYIEVETDVAFNSIPGLTGFTGYLSDCAPDLQNALTMLEPKATAPGVCLYN